MNGATPIRVYVADAHALSRYGIVRALSDSERFDLVGETGDGQAALAGLRQLEPDVAIVARRLPCLSSVEVLGLIRAERRRTKILLLDGELDAATVYAGFKAGAAGYISTDTTGEGLRELVVAAAQGQPILPHEIQRALLHEIQKGDAEMPALTPREREILGLIAEGQPTSQIAAQLHVSPGTAKKHLSNVYGKLDVGNSAAAVARAMRLGLLE